MKEIFKRHSLSIILITIFVIQSVLGGRFYYNSWVSEQQLHGQPTNDIASFWNDFSAEYLISILADTYGAVLLVILTKKLYEAGSAESKKKN